jgi:hypothetical protein
MHPAFVTAIADAQRQDKLAQAAASRRARQVRLARAGSRPEHGARHAVRRQHGPAEPLRPAVPSTQVPSTEVPSTHTREKIGV